MTRNTELAEVEAELVAFEASLWARVGLEPDGPVDAYLNESDFATQHRLAVLRERVSELMP